MPCHTIDTSLHRNAEVRTHVRHNTAFVTSNDLQSLLKKGRTKVCLPTLQAQSECWANMKIQTLRLEACIVCVCVPLWCLQTVVHDQSETPALRTMCGRQPQGHPTSWSSMTVPHYAPYVLFTGPCDSCYVPSHFSWACHARPPRPARRYSQTSPTCCGVSPSHATHPSNLLPGGASSSSWSPCLRTDGCLLYTYYTYTVQIHRNTKSMCVIHAVDCGGNNTHDTHCTRLYSGLWWSWWSCLRLCETTISADLGVWRIFSSFAPLAEVSNQ